VPDAVVVSQAPQPDIFSNEPISGLVITLESGTTLAQLVDAIGRAAGVPVHADWDRRSAAKLTKDRTIGLPLVGVRLEDALRAVNANLAEPSGGEFIAARRSGGIVEISTLAIFDRREVVTRAYDIRPLLPEAFPDRHLRLQQLIDTMMTTIEPAGWRANGGDLARMSELDGRLFLVAPPRYHSGVAWALSTVAGRELEVEASVR